MVSLKKLIKPKRIIKEKNKSKNLISAKKVANKEINNNISSYKDPELRRVIAEQQN